LTTALRPDIKPKRRRHSFIDLIVTQPISNLPTAIVTFRHPPIPRQSRNLSVMASDSTADDSAKLKILKDALYDEIKQHGSETRLFSQRDLLDLNIIPNGNVLLLVRVVQGLCDDKLLVGTTNHHAGLAWRWRSREEAKK
jgi:hypothetical protein